MAWLLAALALALGALLVPSNLQLLPIWLAFAVGFGGYAYRFSRVAVVAASSLTVVNFFQTRTFAPSDVVSFQSTKDQLIVPPGLMISLRSGKQLRADVAAGRWVSSRQVEEWAARLEAWRTTTAG
jgi:hypothetical protein